MWTAGLLAALVLAAGPAQAYRVVPLTIELAPSGREAKDTFRIENDGSEPLALQVIVMKREMDLDGKEKLTPADDQFVIFPPQLVLLPKQNQAVRVQWTGTAKPETELAYRFITEQLPIQLKKGPPTGAQVNILLRYEGTLYIVPPGAEPDLMVESARKVNGADGPLMEIILENRGDRHVVMGALKLLVQAGGSSVELPPERLEGMAGANVLARSRRRFTLPWPAGLPDAALEVGLDYRPLR